MARYAFETSESYQAWLKEFEHLNGRRPNDLDKATFPQQDMLNRLEKIEQSLSLIQVLLFEHFPR